MYRKALEDLKKWWSPAHSPRKPLIIRGARQVGKSYLVGDFCARQGLTCCEINFEKEPSLRRLFVEGHNSRTISLLEAHFGKVLNQNSLLFLDEIQAAPEVLARLRYFYEDSPDIAVIGAGSLLEFSLAELEHSVPVGRIQYLYLGPMGFEEYLLALNEGSLLDFIKEWRPGDSNTDIPGIFHDRLLSHVRDFSLIGGMPESIYRFMPDRSFIRCEEAQRSIIETYRNDFGKYRKRIPLERLERVFDEIPAQVGKKWVHARIHSTEKAQALDAALQALCYAKVGHRVFHSSGNGVPLSAEKKDNLFKVLFLDVGLMGVLLGLRVSDLLDVSQFERVNEGAIAEQWIGQHLLALGPSLQAPQLFYWVREKAGSMAEVDYLFQEGPYVIPVEVKAGSSSRAKSLQVFLSEKKKTPLGIHFSTNQTRFQARSDGQKRILELPFYMVEQVPRLLSLVI